MRPFRLMGITVALLLLLAVVFPLAVPQRTVRAAGPIQVTDQKVVSKFRQSMTFSAKATSSAGKIIKARLVLQSRGTSLNIARPVEKFDPASEVSVRYVWDTSGETTPPWQIMKYRWEFTDDAGNVFNTDQAQTEISDDTRNWQKLTDGKVAVYWYDQDETFGKNLLAVAQQGFAHVQKATGHTPDGELRVVMYNNQEDFCTFYAPFECKDWVAGSTFGSITVEWMEPDPDYVMKQVVPHELAHAFLQDWLGPRIQAIPSWFDEGQAVNNQIEGADVDIQRARDLAKTNQLERLAYMEARDTIGQDQLDKVADWYGEAASLVAYLYDRFGLDILGKIVGKVNDGQTFEDAFTAATHLTMDEFETGWREWLGATEPAPTIPPTETMPDFPPTPTSEPFFAATPTPSGQ